MGKHKKANCSLKDPRETRKENESERRLKERESINRIRSVVPLFKKNNAKSNKNEFLRSVTGYVKFLLTFKNTSVEPLPLDFDGVFRSLLRSDAINVFVCDGDLNIIFCSESSFKDLGYQQSDVICRKLSSLVHESDRHGFEREISALKNDVIESINKDFNITCRMIMKKNSKKAPDEYHLVRITGTIEYRRQLLTNKVAIEKAKNTHLSIRWEDSPNYDSAILIRGSIGCLKDPDYLSSQIDYMFVNQNEYRLVMNPAGKIVFACHRMVSIIGFQPEEVIGRSAYEFIYEEDRQVSLYAHTRTLAKSKGVIVHRLLDAREGLVYLQSDGRMENTDTVLFHTIVTPLSDEEGEKRRLEFVEQLIPFCRGITVKELQDQVDNVANEKLSQLESQLAAAKNGACVNKAANSSNNDSGLQLSTPFNSSSPSTSNTNSAFHDVLNESAENELLDIASIVQSSPPGPSSSLASQPSPLSTSSSSLPTLSSSTSLPSSSTQSPLSQSPSSQPCSSQSPPAHSLSSQSLTPESQFTHCSSDSSSTLQSMPSSASLSINYPVYATMNPYVPPTVISSFPTNQRILQNKYYQFGANQICEMTSGQNSVVTNPRQTHIIITTQCTIPEQQTFFSAPVNNSQIILQPTFPQYQTYNYNQDIQNIAGLDINQELQRVNVDDFAFNLDYESEQDLKQ